MGPQRAAVMAAWYQLKSGIRVGARGRKAKADLYNEIGSSQRIWTTVKCFMQTRTYWETQLIEIMQARWITKWQVFNVVCVSSSKAIASAIRDSQTRKSR